MRRTGFTLIELLVVVSIIAILSTLAIVSLNQARAKARDAKRVSDIKQVQTALELFLADRNGYPAGENLTLGTGNGASLSRDNGFAASPAGTTYMAQVPANPRPGGIPYTYNAYTTKTKTSICSTTPCAWYEIRFELEDVVGSLSAGSHLADPAGMK